HQQHVFNAILRRRREGPKTGHRTRRCITKAAALESAEHNIRVNSVHPGGINTNIEVKYSRQLRTRPAVGRIAEPREVANMILFLLSGESSFSTGSEFVVDGGFTAQ